MMSLTHMQAQCLDFIDRFQKDNQGVSPSFDEIRQELGLASKSGVHRLVAALKERGRLRQPYHRARAFEIVRENPFEGVPTTDLWVELQRRGEVRRAA
jgi:repressor LexA